MDSDLGAKNLKTVFFWRLFFFELVNFDIWFLIIYIDSDFNSVPYKEKEIEKKYYSIGEVAAMFNVATSLIRFWESEFDIIKPKKNRKGNRQFTKDDIQNVKLIYHLVKEKGYTLQGAKTMLKNGSQAAMDRMDVVESLRDLRVFLTEIKSKL